MELSYKDMTLLGNNKLYRKDVVAVIALGFQISAILSHEELNSSDGHLFYNFLFFWAWPNALYSLWLSFEVLKQNLLKAKMLQQMEGPRISFLPKVQLCKSSMEFSSACCLSYFKYISKRKTVSRLCFLSSGEKLFLDYVFLYYFI